MQNFRLHKKLYHTSKIDEAEYSQKVYARYEKLQLYRKLRKEGCSEAVTLEAIKISRATYFRWKKRYELLGLAGLEEETCRPKKIRQPLWTLESEQLVLAKRKKYPLWGKCKLAAIIKKETGRTLSPSTVGRILKKLIQNGKVSPVNLIMGKRIAKPRKFPGHAQRWCLGMKTSAPGELVQVDHMTVQLADGTTVKHFTAVCPITKLTAGQVYKRACSVTAAKFLEHIKHQFPFKISSIQVDGGSEFMGVFEKTCQRDEIKLYVLPPRSPEYNGHVERSNGTAKYEFYYQYTGPNDLMTLQNNLQRFAQFYNQIRPHQGLNYLTPQAYYDQITKEAH